MKQVLVLMFLFGCILVTGQDSKVTHKLEPFKEVKGFDGLSINLIKSTENKAIISGENTSSVAIVNIEGVLKIRMQIGKIFSGYKTFVDLYYSDKILVIDVNEDARIVTKDKIKQEVLELKAQEGGELIVNAEVEQMLIKSVSGGVIRTTGSSNLQDVQINTGGVYEGKDFNTNFCTINVNAGSRAEINAKDYVKATVKAGGEVLVYGNPKKLEEKTVFGGTIKRM
ncbi:Putative auto-transporter adhesin, head GIN domain [Maribacter orientalis]|uniref:Putative auto-transporter adhesin, head GIN domain n=1 Tax=Maribacter orientalis TaxID=228957 RepID=A0A1H7X601_9FLAO|nr:head GIN domain-containing protein [Maribacter orientalis]SEM29266.1 Putative auto-transporter adhesin, head GIN domain [Maribacter orientalis]|tara:strand:- start:1008 stop:1685 length:678 start_codon:yes stop_codon:yes gene_type:complete